MSDISSTLVAIMGFYVVALLVSKNWSSIENAFGLDFIEEALSIDRAFGNTIRIIIYSLILLFVWFGPGFFSEYGSGGFRVGEAKVAISKVVLTPIFLWAIFMAVRRIIYMSRAK